MASAGKRKRRLGYDGRSPHSNVENNVVLDDPETLELTPTEITVSSHIEKTLLQLFDSNCSVEDIFGYLEYFREEKLNQPFSSLQIYKRPLSAIVQGSLIALGISEADSPKLYAPLLVRALLNGHTQAVAGSIRRFSQFIDLRTCAKIVRHGKQDVNIDLLSWAIMTQSNEIVELCVKCGNLYIAAMVACVLGSVGFFRILFAEGFSVNRKIWDPVKNVQRLPIDIAVASAANGSRCHFELIQLLISLGATIGRSTISAALDHYSCNPELAELVLGHHIAPEIFSNLFLQYCGSGDSDVVQRLLQLPDCKNRIKATDSNGCTCLMLAAESENVELLRNLLTCIRVLGLDRIEPRTADVRGTCSQIESLVEKCFLDFGDRNQNTALHYALKANAISCAILLLDAGADPLRQNKLGVSALEAASQLNDGLPFLRHAIPLLVGKLEEHRTYSRQTCSICLERSSNTALIPCGHFGFCEQDALTVLQNGACPICRRNVTSTIVLFPCFAE